MTLKELDGDETLLVQDISSSMNYVHYPSTRSIVWTLLEPLASFSIVFDYEEEEDEFTKVFTSCIYETQLRESFSKLSIIDQNCIVGSTTDNEKLDSQISSDSEFYDLTRDDDESEEEEEDEEEDSDSESDDGNIPEKKYKNTEAADSYRHLRSFVVRGPNIGVFKRGDKPEYIDTLADIKSTSNKKEFIPTSIMLYNHDNNLLCLHDNPDEDNQSIVYNVDLNRGEVVDEWTAAKYTPVLKMAPLDKYAPRTSEAVFSAMNTNTLFSIDPRLSSKEKAVDVNKYTYAKNPSFTSLGTSADGSLAVGNKKGEIRMYSGTPGCFKRTKSGVHPKTAKVMLSGLGEPIKSIDVSLDSKWVVATCDSYLMLIDTSLPNDSNCFQGRASADDKPVPKLLRLKPIDQRTVGKVSFSHARFNAGSDGETWIVSSTGQYLITWNFKEVKKGNLQAYTMKKENDERVVDSQFAATSQNEPAIEAPILVVTPDNLFLEHFSKTSKNPYSRKRNTYSNK